ncbi:hypothetical protein SAMN04488008_1176 [Maribacter orientalis]|uniref:Uncharacterized protein n=1 Tax=Maribacter orientalis TaxID=228957 RepID=A0A1H7XG32_9FLAO|nr:hypothetical protein [Maribacter orientalis]SEM32574.1 hypothetical protein SAMN04488008_1176 [Maribacter orientalis]
MQKDLKIIHEAKSFSYRIGHFILLLVCILLIFSLIFLFKQQLQNLTSFLGILTLVFGGLIGYKMWQNKLYVVDVESDSNIINIRYNDKNIAHNISSNIKMTEVTLKNTSSRAGFDCELKMRIDNKNYVITDTFDWSLSEMKLLFEYIKHYKNESLSDKEKFNLSRMTEKIKKTHYNKT